MSEPIICYYCHKPVEGHLMIPFTIQYDPHMYASHLKCRARKIGMHPIVAFFNIFFGGEIPLYHDVKNWDDSFYKKPKNWKPDQ